MEKLNILNNKAVRILSNKQYFQIYGETPGPLPSSEPLYKKLEILKFYDIFQLSVANFVYPTLDLESPQIFHDWFKFDYEIHSHNTRLATDVVLENCFDIGHTENSLTLHNRGSNNKHGAKMLQVLGPLIWNKISEKIQKASSIHTFKNHLKTFYLEQYDQNN